MYTPKDFFAEARNEAEVDNFLNNDLYKFLMLDFILAHPEYKDLEVNRKMLVRSKNIKTAKIIPMEALKEQLEYTKNMWWIWEKDIAYLRSLKKPNGEGLFQHTTLDFLKNIELPDYELNVWKDENYELEFTGPWKTSLLGEIFGLRIINSAYLYHYITKSQLTDSEFSHIIDSTLSRLYDDINILKQNPEVQFLEYGTRRSFSTLFHKKVYEILHNEIPKQCIWTSNVMFSQEFWTIPKWTNAHELRMIPTTLYDEPQKIIDTMYQIDREWIDHFPDFSFLLPDTYGTSFYFKNCPKDIFEKHIGCRFDSKDPFVAIPEYVEFIIKNGGDPMKQYWMPSDGLNAVTATEIYNKHSHQLSKLLFGIWTHLSNNTKNTFPRTQQPLWPFWSFSVVIKPNRVKRPDGTRISCVKLSDNINKASGEAKRVELFKKTFGQDGIEKTEVSV